MPIGKNDLAAVNRVLQDLKGRASWSVKLGHGSFVTMDFGNRLLSPEGREHGEWYLWIYCTAWRLDSETEILAGSEDERDVMAPALASLTGTAIRDISVTAPSLSLDIDYGARKFRTFSITAVDEEHWMLYLPSGDVLTAGPGASWSKSRWSEEGKRVVQMEAGGA